MPFWHRTRMQRIQAARRRLGRLGEAIAARVLEERGMECLWRNYRYKRDEIDLVCRDGPILCFVEVKTRGKRGWRCPADAVTAEKRRNVIRASYGYLRAIGKPRVKCRYDIVEVQFEGGTLQEVRHWPGAFSPKKRPGTFQSPKRGVY